MANEKYDEKFEEGLPEEQKKILAQFRKDLATHPIRPLNKHEGEIYANSVFSAQQRVPSFRDALSILKPYMDATSSTAYTDRHARVGLSYWFFNLATADERVLAILHESMHVMNHHFNRAETMGLKPRMMNYAGDLEINTGLATIPAFAKPLENFLIPKHYGFPDFKSMEIYAGLLQEEVKEKIKEAAGDPDDGSDAIDNAQGEQDDSNDPSDGNENGQDSGSGDSSQDGSGGSETGSESGSEGDSGGSDSSSGGAESSGEGDSGGYGSKGSSGGSGSSGSGSSGGSGSDGTGSGNGSGQSSSGQGEAYDDYVRKAKGEGGSGGSGSLRDLVDEETGKKGKCSGKHSKSGNGEPCDGSCGCDPQDGDSGDSNDSDSSGNGSTGDRTESSIDNYKKSIGGNPGKIKVKKPIRHCDDSTVKRSEAADNAGIPKTSTIEQNIARNNTAARVVEELNSGGRGSGTSSEFLKIALSMMTPPKVDWRDLFRSAVATAYSASVMGRTSTSYKRVNRRYSQGSIIFPGTIDHSPTVMFGIDTSGSMGGEDFRAVLSEIESIIKSAARQKNSLKVFSVDTTIQGVQPVSSVGKLKLVGGGGTDMSVAFDYINSLHKREVPSIFVLGTDGGTDWNSVERSIRESSHSYHSIILVTQKSMFEHVPESLHQVATVLDISED